MRYRHASERRAAVLALVQQYGFASISDLSSRLGVSAVTIRRDVAQLAREEKVQSTHGGVLAVAPPTGEGTHFRLRSSRRSDAKTAIAATTVEILAQRGFRSIGIDAGTTALEVAALLHPAQQVSVFSHSLPVLSTLNRRPFVETVGVGGLLYARTQAFAGPATVEEYSKLRFEALVLAASAVRDGQMLCGNDFDTVTKQQMMRVADTTLLVVDSSKFGTTSPFFVEPLDRVDTVITDEEIDAATADGIRAAGVELVTVPVPGEAEPARTAPGSARLARSRSRAT